MEIKQVKERETSGKTESKVATLYEDEIVLIMPKITYDIFKN